MAKARLFGLRAEMYSHFHFQPSNSIFGILCAYRNHYAKSNWRSSRNISSLEFFWFVLFRALFLRIWNVKFNSSAEWNPNRMKTFSWIKKVVFAVQCGSCMLFGTATFIQKSRTQNKLNTYWKCHSHSVTIWNMNVEYFDWMFYMWQFITWMSRSAQPCILNIH